MHRAVLGIGFRVPTPGLVPGSAVLNVAGAIDSPAAAMVHDRLMGVASTDALGFLKREISVSWRHRNQNLDERSGILA